MVLLTMTPAIVRALEAAEEFSTVDFGKLQLPSEPSLVDPKAGNPVSHGQLIDLSKVLKKHASEIATREDDTRKALLQERETTNTRQDSVEPLTQTSTPAPAPAKETPLPPPPIPTTLATLLRNSHIYIAPPPAKKTQTPEYHALMARLRAEEEAKAYERMTNPSSTSASYLPKIESFAQRFPNASSVPQNFSVGANVPTDEEELSYEEVHRQVILIINVLVSVVACAVFIWMAARHWSAPKRLGLSMGGSGAVAIAEVVVYSGYVRKVAEAKRREKRKPEIKEILESWVIDGSEKKKKDVNVSSSMGAKEKTDDGVRYRKGKHR